MVISSLMWQRQTLKGQGMRPHKVQSIVFVTLLAADSQLCQSLLHSAPCAQGPTDTCGHTPGRVRRSTSYVLTMVRTQ